MSTKKFAFAATMGLAVAAGSVLTPRPAHATLVEVSSRAALGADLTINWNAFGPAGSQLSCFCEVPVGPIGVHINSSSGELNRFEEGSGYTGNFAVGDQLLSQPFISDGNVVGFSTAVAAVGTQIQPVDYTGSFTAYVHVQTNDNMDATFSVTGDSTAAEDNSAPFIGVTSTTDDIVAVNFIVDIGNPGFPMEGAVTINQLDVAVPEPGSIALLMSALFLLIPLVGRSKRR